MAPGIQLVLQESLHHHRDHLDHAHYKRGPERLHTQYKHVEN